MPNYILSIVPVTALDAVWKQVAPLLELANTKGRGGETLSFQYVKLANNTRQLWIAAEEDQIGACLVTQVYEQSDGLTVCYVTQMAGEPLDIFIEFEEQLYNFALMVEADVIRFRGRKGWEKRLKYKDYHITQVIYEKNIKPTSIN